jgi:hypothetical protein
VSTSHYRASGGPRRSPTPPCGKELTRIPSVKNSRNGNGIRLDIHCEDQLTSSPSWHSNEILNGKENLDGRSRSVDNKANAAGMTWAQLRRTAQNRMQPFATTGVYKNKSSKLKLTFMYHKIHII